MQPTRACLALSLLLLSAACNRESSSGTGGAGNAASAGALAANVAPPAATSGAAAAPIAAASAKRPPVEVVTLPDVFIAEGAATTLHVAWKIPAGTGINDEAPFHVRWTTSVGLSEVPPEAKSKGADVHLGFDITVAPLAGEPAAQLGGLLSVVVCDAETHKVCLPVQRRIEVTFSVQKGGKQKVYAEVALPAARPQG